MAAYARVDKFMKRVRAANRNFERFKTSSLRPLIDILNDSRGTVKQVRQALQNLPQAKVKKYKEALLYLLATYPGLPKHADEIDFGPLGTLEAAQFNQTALPGNYDPSNSATGVGTAPHRLGVTVEQFVIARRPGIILIHMSEWDDGMGEMFEGRRCLDHIRSVLDAGRRRKCDLCILSMFEDKPVLAELLPDVGRFDGRLEVVVPRHHMGGREKAFRDFAWQHWYLVVMGFDATICVDANLFGAAETLPNGRFIPPLVTLANVVTSRAVLVTTGKLYSKARTKDNWGWLYGT